MRRVALLLFALMQAQVIVALAIAPTSVCPEQCPDDEADGRCAPMCSSCASSTHTPRPIPPALVTVPPARHEALPVLVVCGPGDPSPHDIFHVPRRLLA
jgi:hypothetical protein